MDYDNISLQLDRLSLLSFELKSLLCAGGGANGKVVTAAVIKSAAGA